MAPITGVEMNAGVRMSWHSAGRLGRKGKGDNDIHITTESL